MTRETKVGLMMITILFSVFGFMIYKRAHRPLDAQADQVAIETETQADLSGVGSKPEADEMKSLSPRKGDAPAWTSSEKSEKKISTRSVVRAAHSVADLGGSDTTETMRAKPSSSAAPELIEVDSTAVKMNVAESLAFDSVETSKPKSVPLKPKPKLPTVVSDDDPFAEPAPSKSVDAASAARASRREKAVSLEPEAQSDPFNDWSQAQPPAKDSKNGAASFENAATQKRLDAPGPSKVIVPQVGSRSDEFHAPVQKSRRNDQVIRQVAGEDDPFGDVGTPTAQPQPVPNISTNARPAVNANIDEFSPRAEPNLSGGVSDPNGLGGVSATPATSNRSASPASPNDVNDRLGGFRPVEVKQRAMNEITREAQAANTAFPAQDPLPSARRAGGSDVGVAEFGTKGRTQALIRGDTYDVEPNDNYWTISRKKYGSGRYFLALSQLNQNVIPDPKRMKPGVTISTPPAEVLERDYSTLIPKAAPGLPTTSSSATGDFGSSVQTAGGTVVDGAAAGFFVSADGIPMYRVGEGDTLSDIAQKHLGRSSRWVQILEINRATLADGNALTIGTVLRLPGDASKVDVVGATRTVR